MNEQDKGKVRRTIYLNPETDKMIEELQTSYRNKSQYFPSLSRTAWMHVLLEAGISAVAQSLEEIKWHMGAHKEFVTYDEGLP